MVTHVTTICSPTNLNSPGQNTGVGSLSLLQGIFSTHGLNPGLPHCRQILYQLSHQGSPRILEWVAYPFPSRSSQLRNWTGVSCIAGRFLTNWATREVQSLAYISFNPPTDKATEAQHVGTGEVWAGPRLSNTCDLQGSELPLAKPSPECSSPPLHLVESFAFLKQSLAFYLPELFHGYSQQGWSFVSLCPQSYFKAFLLQFLLLASFLHAFLRVCKILTARCLGNQDWRYIIHLWSLALAQGLVSVICSILFGKIRKEGRNFLHCPTTIYGMEQTNTHTYALCGRKVSNQ